MERYKLISDSSCDLYKGHPQADFSVDFETVPLSLMIGDKEYIDVAETDCDKMFSEMKSFKGSTSSACPSTEAFYQQFKSAERIIAILMTAELSATYNMALMAKKQILAEHPEKKIAIIDSRAAAGVLVSLLRYADQMIKAGVSFEEIEANLTACQDTGRVLCVFSSFENLVKSGRMSKLSGKFASALNIRAIAVNKNGKIELLEKVRGERKVFERAVDLMGTFKDMKGKPVVITHCYNEDGAMAIAEMVKNIYGTQNTTILKSRCLTSYYTDDKGIMISF